MMFEALSPSKGGFLRPFGCGWFIREFLLGKGLMGSPRNTCQSIYCRTRITDPRWKLIEHRTVEYKGETFHRKLWVAICGGAVEYTEDVTPEGEGVYQVERFELEPESWHKETAIPHSCSMIVSDRYNTPEEAIKQVDFHKESITLFWWKVEKG